MCASPKNQTVKPRKYEGIFVSVEGNISMHNDIRKTSMGKTYHGYLKSKVSETWEASYYCSDEMYLDAWLDSWSYRFKKKVLRMLKHLTHVLKR